MHEAQRLGAGSVTVLYRRGREEMPALDNLQAQYGGERFEVVANLLSVSRRERIRLRTQVPAGDPTVPSLFDVHPGAEAHERETYDMFGIVFDGHPDLRRILTDYGFIGHPFRKDFPISGNVEMRYDPDQQRVIYQPVTIEPREITPRVIREENYGDLGARK